MSVEYKTKYEVLRTKLNEEVLKEERKYPLGQRERMLVDIINELLEELDNFTRTGTTRFILRKDETI